MDKSWLATVAGILAILAGIASLFGGVILGFTAALLDHIPDLPPEFPLIPIRGLFICLAAMILATALVSISGGIAAIRRRRWGWALAGTITATLTLPPLGVPALILVVLAEGEFRRHAETCEPPVT